MPIAFWREDYRTGNELVDQQHLHLFDLVNALHDAMLAGEGKDLLAKTLDELAQYTHEHFSTEEALMLERHYPDYAEHKEQHVILAGQVVDLVHKYQSGEIAIGIELSQFLTDWLIHHIKGEDLKLFRYLRGG
ncbi:MAG: bacteriohemerythrin [Prochlorotrichaceae cyanobacterium]|jgi:hemerythrin